MDGTHSGALAWQPPAWRDVLRWPLPHKGIGDRLLIKTVALVGARHIRAIHGIENALPDRDPFILVGNHSTKRDTVLTPAMLMLKRGGRPIHYLADWNPRLIPGVGLLYRTAGVITVTRKPARPRFLNIFKRLYDNPITPIERARQRLTAGQSVGFFPEGTINRDPSRLLVGRSGAARLSLETGVPILPVGIRFPEAEHGQPATGAMEVFIGGPLTPPAIASTPVPYSAVRDWHATLMSEIASLSGKTWSRGDR